MINLLRYTKRLEDLGVSRELAEAHLQIIAEVIEGDVATKQDLVLLKESLEHRILEVKEGLEHKILEVKEGLEHKILQSEYRLTMKLGAMMTVAAGITIGVMTLILK